MKKAAGPGGEHGLLLVEVGYHDGQDRAGRRLLGAVAPDVGLAERPLPGERLRRAAAAAPEHRPGAPAVVALDDLRKRRRDAGHVVETHHGANGIAARIRA
ncbi:hypothetical protein BJF78_22795 [Pseudonocardia sp. CNS-139]|nr:hypothetical protein BJF78_22795 [Pseudonocardia sp. CNS-139]